VALSDLNKIADRRTGRISKRLKEIEESKTIEG